MTNNALHSVFSENPFLHPFLKIAFLPVTFVFLAHITVLSLALVTFRSILAISWSFGRIQKSKMAILRWPPFGNYDLIARHMTSSLRDVNLKGDIFGRTIHPTSLTVINLILTKLCREGGGLIAPLPLHTSAPEDKNMPGEKIILDYPLPERASQG